MLWTANSLRNERRQVANRGRSGSFSKKHRISSIVSAYLDDTNCRFSQAQRRPMIQRVRRKQGVIRQPMLGLTSICDTAIKSAASTDTIMCCVVLPASPVSKHSGQYCHNTPYFANGASAASPTAFYKCDYMYYILLLWPPGSYAGRQAILLCYACLLRSSSSFLRRLIS